MAAPTSLCREEWTLELVAGATLAEAMYLALEWEPENPMLQDLAISGLVLLQPKTPIDALCYYRDEANMMVGYGAQRSFVEDFGVIDELEASWKTMRTKIRGGAKDDDENDEVVDHSADIDAAEASGSGAAHAPSTSGSGVAPASSTSRFAGCERALVTCGNELPGPFLGFR